MSHIVRKSCTDDPPGHRWPLGHYMKQLVCRVWRKTTQNGTIRTTFERLKACERPTHEDYDDYDDFDDCDDYDDYDSFVMKCKMSLNVKCSTWSYTLWSVLSSSGLSFLAP